MEGNAPEERLEEEAPAPDESDLPGAEEEPGDGRHLEAAQGNCRWLLAMKTDTFNMTLKCMFILLLLTTLAILLTYHLDFFEKNALKKHLHSASWVFGVYWDGTNITIVLFAALFALAVDVKKSGLKPRPVPTWMIQMAKRTALKLKEFYNKTTAQTTASPHSGTEETVW